LLTGCGEAFEQELGRSFTREFVESCTANGAPETACRCVTAELLKQYSMTDITKWRLTASPDNFADGAVSNCKGERK